MTHTQIKEMDKIESNVAYEEKREYPRIVINSPVNIVYKLQQMEAKIHDISPEGLQIRGDSELLLKVNPNDEIFTEGNAPLIDVAFSLKLFEMDMRINALCKMYYSSTLASEEISEENKDVACGLKFVNFEGDGDSQLDAFITQEMINF